jgi:APA family basic amino acid/polyamine antiporter
VTAPPTEAPTLARRLGLFDAVVIGLGAMIGAGIFAAIAPAAGAAGSWLLVALAIAAAVALCNALASAQLAALYPEAGGTYVYGRQRLGDLWGYLAGWGFVIGKVASCAAMALTFGFYVDEDLARPLGVAAVGALTVVNVLGVQKTARVATILVVLVIATLVLPVASIAGLHDVDPGRALPSGSPPGGLGLLEGAALLFFAFAGYARIATLGEEVTDPERTIPRAIPIALAITLLIYATVIAAALLALGPEGLATAAAPLAATVDAAGFDAWTPVVRAGAALASLSVLLSLLAGVSRTAFAMSRGGHLPSWLSRVHPRYRTPHYAEIIAGAVIATLAATIDLRDAIGFSSFAVLIYYTVANAAAWTLAPNERRFPKVIAALGVLGCIALAVSLPATTLIAGAILFAGGTAYYVIRRAVMRDVGGIAR